MPNNIIFQGPSMTSGNLAAPGNYFSNACTLAAARGAYGLRVSAGMSGFGGTARINSTSLGYMTTGITLAAAAGLSKVSVLLGFSPKRDGAHIITFNGGVAWQVLNRPPAGTGNGVWLWIVQAWQDIIDTCRAAAIAAGKDPTTFLEFELANEVCKGGVSGPFGPTGAYDVAPYSGYNYGTIEAAWFTMAEYVTSRVNFYSIPTCMTLEGDTSDSDNPDSGGTDMQTEIDSFTGSDATSFVGRLTTVNFNKYSSAPSTPYDAAAVKSAFSTKVQAQVTAMAANAVIGAKQKNLREFGIRKDRCPPCSIPNSVRNDLIVQVKAESNILEGCLYTLYNFGSLTSTDSQFHTYSLANVPNDSTHISI